ncbi:hypothetical protein Tco_1180476 [Tanacetum coccineum]
MKFFKNIFPFKDSNKVKNDTANIFQDVNNINFFDLEYPEIPSDDERVDPKLNSDNKSQNASSSSSESGRNSFTIDFSVNFENDADSSDNIFATQDERYGMLACKPVNTPLISKLVISNKATKKDHVLDNITDYQKLMGKLIYLSNTRPDISYVDWAFIIKNSGMSLSGFSDAD